MFLRALRYFCVVFFALTGSQSVFGQVSDPSDVSGLVFWVDATDVNGTGVQPANGSVVSTWVDKSASGKNLTTQAGTVTFESTGFDSANPGLRFPLDARMAAGNPFAGAFHDEMTLFFVNANVTQTRNFSLSLNGTSQGTDSATGRFSLHTPWIDDNAYFDAGGCCGTSRLRETFPNGITETTLYSAVNDAPGGSQVLRIDGLDFQSDNTGHISKVIGGVHLGDMPSTAEYNGRFAEVVVYDRSLTLDEIHDVECYLLLKWKPAAAPARCTASIAANKTVAPFETTGDGSYALPGNDLIYTFLVTHEGGPDLDDSSIFLVDKLPAEVIFYNDDIDDLGPELNPVSFENNGSTLSLDYPTDIGFSDDVTAPSDMSECDFNPVVGYDPDVTYICINPSGVFSSATPNPSVSISFRAQIK